MRSTGLGKTLLSGSICDFEFTNIVPETLKDPQDSNSEPKRLLVTMKTIAPVSWKMHIFIEPGDLRYVVGYFIKHPLLLLKAISMLILGGKSPSLTVKKREDGKAGTEGEKYE